MNASSTTFAVSKSSGIPAIFWGGLIAGVFDLCSAFITWGLRGVGPARICRGIASGLLGPRSFDGGVPTAILGFFLHFFIAFSAAAVFYIVSRKLGFLIEHPYVSGMFYGIAVYLVMKLIVLPLSAVGNGKGPYTLRDLIQGLLVHMILIGLPISLSARRFSR